jgi:hypothetical protein
LTFHVSRHTCATTINLDNGIPLEVVSKRLGHTSIRSTQIYAKAHLQEVYFTLNGKYRIGNKPYFALYFPNESGGAELRSKQFKGGTAPKSYSFIRGISSNQVNIYEGFTDFLSGLSSKGSSEPAYDSIILNSVAMFRKAAPAIRKYARANCFLDNDEAGNNAFSQISQLVETVDYRSFYADFKDLGEWW